jgi:peptidoglycan/xylan/chitin deacetylase (PgdA/CDA1 family)
MDADTLRTRRQLRRLEIRRRRRRAAALVALLVALIAVALIVALGSHSDSSPARSQAKASGAARAPSADASRVAGPARDRRAVSGPPGTEPVPILMYHVIAAPPPGAPFPGLYVQPQEFAEQMQALKDAGWHAVTLDQVAAYWQRGVSLGAGKPIVLSFDNGYQSQYAQALPVLRRLGWVGVENMQLTGLPPSQGGLGQQEIHALVGAGWELDTQGFSHADLITLSPRQLRYQVAVAREVVRRRYGVPVNWFCYPSGHYDATVVAEVRAAGYKGSTTVVPGWAHPGDDPYRLHRLRVLGGTSAGELLALLSDTRADPPAPPSYGEA